LPVASSGGVCLLGTATTITTEDCLNLNLYTPKSAARRPLPVMVWIFGGGFAGESASAYDGAVLAAKGNAIVVTMNYRLSAFGFLDLPLLGAGNDDFGLLDQQAALRPGFIQLSCSALSGGARPVPYPVPHGPDACDIAMKQ
jgi:para-nitrobenzyl esterase